MQEKSPPALPAPSARGIILPESSPCGTRGGMAERAKAVVLKTTERKLRGFESLSLRQKRPPRRARERGTPGEMAEWLKALAC